MTSKRMRCWLLALCAALFAGAASQDAIACACCTSTGERFDLVTKVDKYHVEELQRVRFDGKAVLFLGEAEPEMVKGISTPAARYELKTDWQNNRMVFLFRDQAQHAGTLSVAMPRTISIFSVDPRPQSEGPRGPALYKEWRLTSPAAGTGIFTPGIRAGQNLTLVLQGSGNNCTSANDFSHWMLVMDGPKAKYHFFGGLTSGR